MRKIRLVVMLSLCILVIALIYGGSYWSYKAYQESLVHSKITNLTNSIQTYVDKEEYKTAYEVANELAKIQDTPALREKILEINHLWLKQRILSNVKHWKSVKSDS